MATDTKNTFLDELRWRGFLEAVAGDGLEEHLASGRRTMYVGFDPTADSLHLGSLVPVMALAHAQRHGHRPLVLVGDGTGLIGDPSGRSSERTLLTKEMAAHNAGCIRAQLAKFFDLSSDDKALMLHNSEWLVPLNFIDFLRDIGKHFSVNEMVKRDSVRMRLEEREQGLSFTEFSYMLLQSYDFLHLFQHADCSIQMGGKDQWGNILSGMDLIRRIAGGQAYCITFPLLTTSAGKKFGKSEEGAIYLDAARTSPYQMYQYWIQTPDLDVVRFLKLFTFLSKERIGELEREVAAHPEKREAQRVLAAECTALVHGAETVRAVEAVSRILFSGSEEAATAETVALLAREVPVTEIARAELDAPIGLVDLLVRTGLASSKGAARKLIESGGVYLNNRREDQPQKKVSSDDLKWPGALLLRSGKKNYHLVQIA